MVDDVSGDSAAQGAGGGAVVKSVERRPPSAAENRRARARMVAALRRPRAAAAPQDHDNSNVQLSEAEQDALELALVEIQDSRELLREPKNAR